MVLHMKDFAACGTWLSSWSEVILYYTQFLPKNRRLLWIGCRNPFPGRSLHRVFSFNVTWFIVKFQLVMETIMVKLSARWWVHVEGRGGQLPWPLRRLCVWSMLDMFHTAQQLRRIRWICLQSFYIYACSFMHVKEITYSKGKKGSSNLSAQSWTDIILN